mmetsp:Transcript_89865/g.159879  ORF Transcript_89865/g.159879 Transcript_89865/m.159879 type:complete len:421 (-) Transcript_89865:78-1340(-)
MTFFESSKFEALNSIVLCTYVLFMALELQFNGTILAYKLNIYEGKIFPAEDTWPVIHSFFRNGDLVFTFAFGGDCAVRMAVLRKKFWFSAFNWLDVLVFLASLVQAFQFDFGISVFYLRLLRIGKLARALRIATTSNALQSLQLLIKCLAASAEMLFWSFALLTFIQCVAGMILSSLVRDYIADDSDTPPEDREAVWQSFGTFSRTMLTMFEILFANWSPVCRLLIDRISEGFAAFFLIYRCVISFAVINVVNAVFVQQTLKTASSDEELAFRTKQRDQLKYAAKVRKLFASVDVSDDGSINFEEFSELVHSPMLKFWMSQLDLEYHDLCGLFEFLDNGKGEITLRDFLDGASRLKGSAKAIDVWRLEVKLEVLLGQVLKSVQDDLQVANVLAQSGWSHLTVADTRAGANNSEAAGNADT